MRHGQQDSDKAAIWWGGRCRFYLDVVAYEVSDHIGNVLVDQDDCYVIPVCEVLECVLDLLYGCLCKVSDSLSHKKRVAATLRLAK